MHWKIRFKTIQYKICNKTFETLSEYKMTKCFQENHFCAFFYVPSSYVQSYFSNCLSENIK